MAVGDEVIKHFAGLNVGDNLEHKKNSEICTAWIKILPLHNELQFADFPPSNDFVKVANVSIDDDMNNQGKKSRKTLIKFVEIDKDVWEKDNEWLYILVVNGEIVKIGGTRKSLKHRVGSYLCGHHVRRWSGGFRHR
jgi:hypothetical protein